MDRLEEMLAMQRDFQRSINGYEAEHQGPVTRITNFKESLFALEHELHEAVDEMGWKSWATSRHFNTERVQAELVDVWHFFMNLMIHAGMSADDLYQQFLTKHEVNWRRQQDGYDGVTGKCRQCHRDLAEQVLKEVISQSFTILYCACGNEISRLPS